MSVFVSVFLALARFNGVRMMSSRAGNCKMLSFAPHWADYRTILTAPQQKSHGRESRALLRFHNARVTDSLLRVGTDAVVDWGGKEPRWTP